MPGRQVGEGIFLATSPIAIGTPNHQNQNENYFPVDPNIAYRNMN